MNNRNLVLKRMGVINITPNSFSGLGEVLSTSDVIERFKRPGPMDVLDLGAESTAPMNQSISWEEEWGRIEPLLPFVRHLTIPLSLDTYHPETIQKMTEFWQKEGLRVPLIWNDVSGKFDSHVERFLAQASNFFYVFCHNLAPTRELAGRHMDVSFSELEGEDYLEELAQYFRPHRRERVILDPTLGFSKTHEQNWYVLEHFGEFQEKVGHPDWLLGFSRKSFLRKRLGITQFDVLSREKVDLYHQEVLNNLKVQMTGTVLIRTHRPDLI